MTNLDRIALSAIAFTAVASVYFVFTELKDDFLTNVLLALMVLTPHIIMLLGWLKFRTRSWFHIGWPISIILITLVAFAIEYREIVIIDEWLSGIVVIMMPFMQGIAIVVLAAVNVLLVRLYGWENPR